MVTTNALHRGYDPNNTNPRSSGGLKWMRLLRHIWYEKEEYEKGYEEKEEYEKGYEEKEEYEEEEEYEGNGVVIMSSDPNTLLESLDLLLASQKAYNMGVRNELVSICDELKRQGVLNKKTYKKLNSIIKNDSH